MTQSIFVFGSNLAGRHGAGSAKEALLHHGAVYGQGFGRQGSSFAIPTKDKSLRSLPLETIKDFVELFLFYAQTHPALLFQVVKIGCGLAGYTEDQIAPMFAKAPPNVTLPKGWNQCP